MVFRNKLYLKSMEWTKVKTNNSSHSKLPNYCINGIDIGYLNLSPFAALILAIITQTIFNIPKNIIIGIPMIIKQRGIASTMYSSMESWKFIDAFPFSFTHTDSSFFDNQQISGPMIAPKGKKKPANADKWQSMAQFLSVSEYTLISSILCSV